MTLATCAEGLPWATDVYFAPDGFDLVFLSSPRADPPGLQRVQAILAGRCNLAGPHPGCR